MQSRETPSCWQQADLSGGVLSTWHKYYTQGTGCDVNCSSCICLYCQQMFLTDKGAMSSHKFIIITVQYKCILWWSLCISIEYYNFPVSRSMIHSVIYRPDYCNQRSLGTFDKMMQWGSHLLKTWKSGWSCFNWYFTPTPVTLTLT